jgi:hypothetical protein
MDKHNIKLKTNYRQAPEENTLMQKSKQMNNNNNATVLKIKDMSAICKLQTPAHILSSRFTCPDDGGDTYFRNVGSNQKYTAQDPRRRFPA